MTINDQIKDEKLQYDINREQAKFTYSLLGKAFDKQRQLKIMGQVQELENLKPIEQNAIADKSDDDESLMQKETYNKLFDERLYEVQETSKEIDYNNLIYYFKTKGSGKINFIKFKGPFGLFKEARD